MLIDSPIGPLSLEASATGLTRIEFGGSDGPSSPLLLDAAEQLAEYFAGQRQFFDLPLDVPAGSFRTAVQAMLTEIPYGRTVTYTELATTCGHPRAVRAAGTACATNPLPIIRPCHRVLRSDGSLGGYRGGLEAKKWLLDHEQRVLGNLRDGQGVQ
ncbi:methylated-DNA--[protein]-cysteine S-methyltransferase [Corynebacterium comes]|uniref:Methylated-DNA--protein-cysteine methyltransferase n=1 Tax=Corynebacterium comes TaxID=2675218 RepID=A0A6B8W2V3_9CORY|nr:methylated-DNA--[protein]-cysteine S-methyltransferase [Corynebacterium comes]QGU04050.1 Methylated-DNA--protein-cysteine methyltransferase, inducible [Corynebacterium comes]